jgi:hypothetical protein
MKYFEQVDTDSIPMDDDEDDSDSDSASSERGHNCFGHFTN